MRLGWDMTGYNGSCKCIYKWNIDIHTVLYTDDVHILYIIHVRKILSYLVLCFVMLCPASLQLRCHFFVLVAICLGPQSTESLKPWGQDRQGHDIYQYAYLPQRKKTWDLVLIWILSDDIWVHGILFPSSSMIIWPKHDNMLWKKDREWSRLKFMMILAAGMLTHY